MSPRRKSVSRPDWIADIEDQKNWNTRFIQILARDYGETDSDISSILNHEWLKQMCATKIRSYVDKQFTDYLYKERKARGCERKKQLDTAIEGVKAAISFYKSGQKYDVVAQLEGVEADLEAKLARWKDAYATKRHGRDRAHSTLQECRLFLESRLGRTLTYVTLANLLNAGLEADNNVTEGPITEEHVRKNLATFERNNPLWCCLTKAAQISAIG